MGLGISVRYDSAGYRRMDDDRNFDMFIFPNQTLLYEPNHPGLYYPKHTVYCTFKYFN